MSPTWVVVELFDDALLLLVSANQIAHVIADAGVAARGDLGLNAMHFPGSSQTASNSAGSAAIQSKSVHFETARLCAAGVRGYEIPFCRELRL
jgi:hypothetical protein